MRRTALRRPSMEGSLTNCGRFMQLFSVVEALQPLQQRPGQVLPPFRKGDEAHAEAEEHEGPRRETVQAHELVHEPEIPWHARPV